MTALRQRMMEDLQIRNYAPSTVRAYVRGVVDFAKHFGRSPDQLGAEQIREYQLFLIKEKGLALPTYIQIVSALRFLYTHTLHRQIGIERIPFPRYEKKLPIILSREEVKRLLEAPKNLGHRTILSTMYAAGPRVSEVAHIKVPDIDSGRKVIWIRGGKGRKDRQTLLPPKLLELLRCYWRWKQPKDWLFPSCRSCAGRSHGQSDLSRLPQGRASQPASPKRFIRTRCGTPSPRTYSKPAWISARFRFCSATRTSRPPHAICSSPMPPCAPPPVPLSAPPRTMTDHRLELADVIRTHERRFSDSLEITSVSREQRKAFGIFATAGPPPSAAMSSSAIGAGIASSCITRAAIGALQQVPGHRARPVARATPGRAVARPLFPRGVYAAARDRPPRAAESETDLHHPLSRCFRDAAHHRGRPQHLGAVHRIPRGAPHLGPRTCISIRTCIASCPAAESHPTAHAGSPREKSFFLPVHVLSRLFLKEVPHVAGEGVPKARPPLLRRTSAADPAVRLRRLVPPGRPSQMGGLRQAALRRSRTRSQVSGSLRTSRCHFQPPPPIADRRPRHLRLQGLRRRLPEQDHDVRRRRVHPRFLSDVLPAALFVFATSAFWPTANGRKSRRCAAPCCLPGKLLPSPLRVVIHRSGNRSLTDARSARSAGRPLAKYSRPGYRLVCPRP